MTIRPALLLRRADAVLTLRYRYGPTDVYGLPGGNPDPGETLPETLVRELREELGLTVRVGGLVLAGEVLLPGRKDVLHAVFEGEIMAGQPVLNPAETSALEAVWLPVADLDGLNLYPNVGIFLKNPPAAPYVGRIDQEWFG
jgi:8-oxo-dGTP pyrophosphatase MutT (NUDIX family)